MSTRIGILVCDHFPPEVQAVAGCDLGELYRRFLARADPTLHFREYDAIAGVLPTDRDECDGWILTGSRSDAHREEAWVLALLEWIRQTAAAGGRMVGVCFGHQAIAQALGGRVERAEGWRVGPQTLAMEATPWFEAGTVELNAMHRDEVTVLPAGATLLGAGTTAAVPAYRIEEQVLCVQDHPEFTRELSDHLIRARRDRIGADVADAALARSATTPTDGDTVGRWIGDFLASENPR